MKIKYSVLAGLSLMLISTITACSNPTAQIKETSSPKTQISSKENTNDTKNNVSSNSKESSTESNNSDSKWSFKDDTFNTEKLSFKFIKSEIHDHYEENKKALVIFTDITNTSNEEFAPKNVTDNMVPEQKTDTANKELDPTSYISSDDPNSEQIENQNEALGDKLLPGKTTHATIIYVIDGKNPVTLNLNNNKNQKIGSKVFDVSN